MEQSFGGPWTLLKLEVLDKYLSFYIKAIGNRFKLCYIDAFAGSGDVTVKGVGRISGSPVRALDYSFNQYIFIEKDTIYVKRLEETVASKGQIDKVQILTGDCNEALEMINSYRWLENGWRGVVFLDPYAMNLKWSSLEAIAKTKAFDVWYLFPLSALSRVLPKGGNIPELTKEKITYLLGTNEWEKEIYRESPQLSLFGEPETERLPIEGIRNYVISRLKTIFPRVSEKSMVLRNPLNNSPLFLLCFAVSNPSKAAIDLSLKVANHILTHT